MNKKIIIIIVVVVVVLAVSFAAWYFTRKKPQPKTTRTITLRDSKGKIIGQKVVTGTPTTEDTKLAVKDAGAQIKNMGLVLPWGKGPKKKDPVAEAAKANPELMGPPQEV
jgi:flagellar basal body-associated protein FliL